MAGILTVINVLGASIGLVSDGLLSEDGAWPAAFVLPFFAPLLYIFYVFFSFYWAGALAILEHAARMLADVIPFQRRSYSFIADVAGRLSRLVVP